jgi:DNA-binding protein HU-beta
MTKAELIAMIAAEAQVKKGDAEKAINAFIHVISNNLKSQGRLSIPGFGKFVVIQRKARTGRNPLTGSKINIPASRVVRFKPGKDVKAAAGPHGPGNHPNKN